MKESEETRNRYWLVVASYCLVPATPDRHRTEPSNVILKGIHPVLWAAREVPTKNVITYLHWFIEIPEEVALDPSIGKWCGTEEDEVPHE